MKIPDQSNKLKVILEKVKGKNVLDIGCIGREEWIGHPQWTHQKICDVAKSVTGIDCNKEAVAIARARGYNIHHARYEDYYPAQKFDMIVMLDMIEHTGNQNDIHKLKRLLKPDGTILITTPNAYNIGYWIQVLALGKVTQFPIKPNDYEGHVILHSEHTLWQLARNQGYKPKDVRFTSDYKAGSLLFNVVRRVFDLRPQFRSCLIMELMQWDKGFAHNY